MCKHESKLCPVCNRSFECKMGDVLKCQCYAVRLNDEEREYIAQRFQDCLCATCILTMRARYQHARKEIQLKQFFGLI